MPSIRPSSLIFLLLVLSAVSLALGLAIGSVTIDFREWQLLLSGGDSAANDLIFKLRGPRVFAAWLTGACLAVSGCLMQVLLRNPLADPYILGVSGGAACAALAGLTLGITVIWLPPLAFLGAMTAMLIVFVLARGKGPWSATKLLLTGVVLASGWGALISLMLSLSPDHSLRGMLYWLMGDLSLAQVPGWAGPVALLLFVICLLRARSLNLLSLGERSAMLLGEDARRTQWGIYIIGSILAAIAVSIAGAVGFVGLIVPHMMRLVGGADHRILLPAAALFGGSFLVLADTLARTVLAPQQLPVGVITALTGVPLFLFLLFQARRL